MSRFEELKKSFEHLQKKIPPGAQAEMHALEKETLNIAHIKGSLDKYGFSQTHAASVRVVLKGCQGLASTEDLSAESLAVAFDSALANAKLLAQSAPDQDFELPKPQDFSIDSFKPRLASLSPEEKIGLSARNEAAAFAADKRIKAVPYSMYSEHQQRRYVFNSNGVALSDESGSCQLNCYPLAEENGESKMAYSAALRARDPRDLNPEPYATQAARASIAKLRPQTPATGRYLCVFSSKAIETFLAPFDYIMSGEAIFEHTSPYSDKIGKSVASSKLTLTSDPHFAGSLRHEAFDDEGSPTRRFDLIENGVFRAPLTNSRWARKLGTENTASAQRPDPHGPVGLGFTNLVVKPGATSIEALLMSAPTLLLIDELEGMAGFNRSTGNFSIPASGFRIENGKATAALDNFVIAGDIFGFLSQIQDVGNELQSNEGEIFAPAILVADVSVAGA